ncbi:NAD(P)-binding domain-containing protein [Parachitinimonas caeni]|uniref:NAD(P)-binding domain-containing protein n=1 Tax=Parachitinimonas caeni TaxID=3031301 RepID=A0ABT7E0J4_9NEIS|nr:NAD(P)-binding domain-containing protein [Parachitinimonas caeni]MDK2125759.1 NAD(P)-binding domain-containing protein [Parachitinimonas caeni]
MHSKLIQQYGVAVLGAGPIGLAAAAQLRARGIRPTIFEAGETVGQSFREVAHVQLFSPWRYNMDGSARALLEQKGWQAPELEALPTAGELLRDYLSPLGAALAADLQLNSRVLAVSRLNMDKIKSGEREQTPFLIRVQRAGEIKTFLAGAVIDATGTWAQPNPLGANGLPAVGEVDLAARIFYGIPDVAGRHRPRYAGKTVLVVGAGHSAAGALLGLADLAATAPRTQLHWATRGDNLRRVLGGGDADQLPARGALGQRLQQLMTSQRLRLHSSFRIQSIEAAPDGLRVLADTPEGAAELRGIDEIICATGSRPDLALTRELRVRLDAWLESAEVLAPLIDPNLHSCGTVRPHGHRELTHPEPGFYIVGAKSYGRAPNFLMATGYEQVRSIAAALAGDMEAADAVQLVLPETGVCSARPVVGTGSACCVKDAQARSVGKAGCGCS